MHEVKIIKFDHAMMMDGPVKQIRSGRNLRQIGWLGQSGSFYPIYTSVLQIHGIETGGYSPVYIEMGE